MPIVEQRVAATPPRKITERSRGAAPSQPPEGDADKKKRSTKPLLIVGILVALLAAAAVAYVVLTGGTQGPAAEPEPTEAVPGPVVSVDSISLNLAEGHYLRLGFAIQLSADVLEELDTAAARDAAISLFSGRSLQEVTDPDSREELKAALAERVAELYGEEVLDVYLTDFVTQ